MSTPDLTRLVANLPSTVPFVGPEAIERRSNTPFTLRLGANESAFGPSPRAVQAMQAAIDRVAFYGDPENHDLRVAAAAHHGVAPTQVVVSAGIDDLLGLVVRAFLEPGEAAVTSLGGYATFAYHVDGFGGQLVRVPYHNDHADLDALASAAHEHHAKLVYLSNPDNPSGTWYTAHEVATFREALPPTCLLVLDEAYVEFAPEGTAFLFDPADQRIVVLRTFSKAYGMAGARIGYLLGATPIVAAFEKIRLHFGVSIVAQHGALAALADQEYLREIIAAVTAGRERYMTLASKFDLPAIPSATNFVMIDVGGHERAARLVAALAARGVFIRMPAAAPLNRCVRLTVGTAEQHATFEAIFGVVWPEVLVQG